MVPVTVAQSPVRLLVAVAAALTGVACLTVSHSAPTLHAGPASTSGGHHWDSVPKVKH